MRDNRRRVLKWAFYIILVCLVYVLQTMHPVSLHGVNHSVNALPFLVAAVSIFETPASAMAFGLITGIFGDAASPSPDGLLMLLYTGAALLICFLSQRYFRRLITVCFIFGGAALVIQRVAGYAFYYSFAYGIRAFDAFITIAGELFVSMLAAIPLYFIVKKIYRKFRPQEDD